MNKKKKPEVLSNVKAERGELSPLNLRNLSHLELISLNFFLSEDNGWNGDESIRINKKTNSMESDYLHQLVRSKVFIPHRGEPNSYYVNIVEQERNQKAIREFRKTSGLDFSVFFK